MASQGLNINVQDMVPGDYSYGYEDGWETKYINNDTVTGATTNNSITLRLMEGDDTVYIYAGTKNDVNTNMNDDKIYVYGGSGSYVDNVFIRSGKDRDYIEVKDGNYDHINGNEGKDVLCNYSEKNPTMYGGKDDDEMHSKGGSCYAYGSEGDDTYILYEEGYMMVKDYDIDNSNGMGSDKINLSNLEPGYEAKANGSGGWDITSGVTGKLLCTVENATQLSYTSM